MNNNIITQENKRRNQRERNSDTIRKIVMVYNKYIDNHGRENTMLRQQFYYGKAGNENNSVNIFYNGDGDTKKKLPILLYVSGGGWTGTDHFNNNNTVPMQALQEGFICAVINHRPVRCHPFALGILILSPFSFYFSHLSYYALLILLLLTMLTIEIGVNRFFHKDATSFANIVNDVARGIAHVHNVINMEEDFNGDSQNLILMGCSSGGHLVSLVILNHLGWLAPLGVPLRNIKAVINVSSIVSLGEGLFVPFRLFIICVYLGFDFTSTALNDLSPIFFAKKINNNSKKHMPTFFQISSGLELPSVRTLNNTLYDILRHKGCDVKHIKIPKTNHFNTTRKTNVILRMTIMLNMFHNKSKDVKQEEEEENKEWQINTKKVIKYSSWIVNAPKTLCELSIPDSIFYFANFTVTAVVELKELLGNNNSNYNTSSNIGMSNYKLKLPSPTRSIRRSEIVGRLQTLTSRHPILRCRVIQVGSHLYWQHDYTFDPLNHMSTRVVTNDNNKLSMDDALQHIIKEESQKPLLKSIPLWRLIQVLFPSGEIVLIFKIHHCIGDGAFITAMLLPLLDTSVPATPPIVRKRRKFLKEEEILQEGKTFIWKLKRYIFVNIIDSMKIVLKQPYMWILQGLTLIKSKHVAVDSKVETTLGISPIIFTSTNSVGKIRKVTGASVSDIILCAIASVVRNKMEDTTLPLLMFMPVMAGFPNTHANLSVHEGNGISGFLVSLPVHISSPKKSLEYLQQQTKPLKKLHVAVGISKLARLAMNFMPRIFLPHVINAQMKMANFFGVSSFRGPHNAQLFGKDLSRFYFFGIFEPPVQPFMCAISSVANRLTVTLVLKTNDLGYANAQELMDNIPSALEKLANDVV